MRAYTGSEVLFMNVKVVELLAVERNHRDALEIAPQEGVVALDVDLLERLADPLQNGPGVVTKVTPRAPVEDEPHALA
jgi:hypothetical protein